MHLALQKRDADGKASASIKRHNLCKRTNFVVFWRIVMEFLLAGLLSVQDAKEIFS